MPFGKRTTSQSGARLPAVGRLLNIVTSERLERLRDSMSELLATADRMATAVREQGLIAVPVTGDETDPEAGPFALRGFTDHFITRTDGRIGHVVYGYQKPNGGGQIDPNAQFHLQQVIGELLAFNLYCQRAELDDALGVALQAPGVGDRIDGILVRLAFFVGLFDNMAAAAGGGILSDDDLERQRIAMERHLIITQNKMFDRSTLEAQLPPVEWPFVGVELPFEPHDDDYFINCVYFPAQHAQVLLAAQQISNSRNSHGAQEKG